MSNGAVQLISNLPSYINVKLGVKRTNNIHLLSSKIGNVKPFLCTEETFITTSCFWGKARLYNYLRSRFIDLRPWELNRKYSIKLIESGNYDVFHPTYFFWYFLDYIKSKPFVLTIHDLTPEHFFENKNDTQIQARNILIEKAAHITVNSKYTRDDVMDYYKVPESRISIIYRGAPSVIPFSKEKTIPFDYILYVGARTECYKNFFPMLKHLRPFFEKHESFKLICTGVAFSQKEKEVLKEYGLENRVINQFCTREGLMNLYSNAFCFIYPSKSEGFGLPILEAYQADCPVLLNNASCFPEIAGDAAVFFEINDKESNLSDQLEQLLAMSSEGKELLLSKQRERLLKYSWEDSSRKLADVYKLVCQ